MQLDGINTNEEIREIIKTRAPTKEKIFVYVVMTPPLKT
jgi:hypothetical protein